MRILLRSAVVALAAVVVVALPACSKSPVQRSISAALINGKGGFTPAVVRVDKGAKVKLKVANTTDKTHGFTITEYRISRTEDPGKPILVQFTANRAGRFDIFCQLHPTHQRAALVVS